LTAVRFVFLKGLKIAVQHEGGLGAYIRHLRLRAAVNDLARFPDIPVKDIGYSVGFNSASDFTRAFRRAYDMTPHEIRLEPTRYTAKRA
jgi:AraC-like DNA-binding protein